MRRWAKNVGLEVVFVGVVLALGAGVLVKADDIFAGRYRHPEVTAACSDFAARTGMLRGTSPPAYLAPGGRTNADRTRIRDAAAAADDAAARIEAAVERDHVAHPLVGHFGKLGASLRRLAGSAGRAGAEGTPAQDRWVDMAVRQVGLSCVELSDYRSGD